MGCQVSKGDIQKHTQRHYCILSIVKFVDKVTNLDFQIEFFMSTASEFSRFLKCNELASHCRLWQYGLWSFHTGGTKLERFLPKNQHTPRKLFNFENWISGGLGSFQKPDF